MKRIVTVLPFIAILFFNSFIASADGKNNAVDDDSVCISLEFMPDSIKETVCNRKFLIYSYGHHGTKWCLIYENGDSYGFKVGTTRKEPPRSVSNIDTTKLMDSHRNLIRWGLDTLPCITQNMIRQYPEQWSVFYHSLSVFDQQSNCIFNSDNAIGFEGRDNMSINENFSTLCYLMYWLSAPEIRHLLPGFEEYVK